MPLLEIKNLHVEVDGKQILNGLDLTVEQGRGARHHGPERLGQVDARLCARRQGRLRGDRGRGAVRRRELLAHGAGRARRQGLFLAFQYPIEIPGVATMTFLRTALNAQRKTRGEAELSTPEFMKRVREARRQARASSRRCCAARSMSASPAARRSATRSCRWRCWSRGSACSTRPIPASTSTRSRSSPTASTGCARRSARFIVITHYQRLLDYIVPDVVHVLSKGRIVRTGGKELALELEAKATRSIQDEAA